MSHPFSSRTRWSLAENDLTRRVQALRASGTPFADLSESNPTRVGLSTIAGISGLLGTLGADLYRPEAFGIQSAREAICAHANRATHELDPARLCLSASTSEAYTWLFKLLCDPGDEVLVPAPSYPLFGFLADVESVRLVSYPLIRDEGFRLDLSTLERSITARTRAIIVVHPNNPTGTFTRRDDASALASIAAKHSVAIISDEVFGDYAWGPVAASKLPSFAKISEALTFVLSGLSKVACAPQLKLAWTSLHGPEDEVARAAERLEVIADTFLSVSTPVQIALPAILDRKAAIQSEVQERLASNLKTLDRAIASLGGEAPVRRLQADAGWSAILEIPRTQTEEEWIGRFLDEEKILLHPGYFFDMDRDGFLIVSLLPEPGVFDQAIERVVSMLARP